MKIWSTQEEADNLFKKLSGKNKAEFARTHQISGGASMLSQHASGHRPISMEAAIIYARALGCKLEEISPRIYMEVKKAIDLVPENTIAASQEHNVAQFNIKDFSKYTDKLNTKQLAQFEELLSYFVSVTEKHQQKILDLAADFYDSDTKIASIARRREMPKGLIEDKKNGSNKTGIAKLQK